MFPPDLLTRLYLASAVGTPLFRPLQMTKTNLLTVGRSRDHIADLDVFHCDHHAINEQLYQLPFLLKGGLLQTTEKQLVHLDKSISAGRMLTEQDTVHPDQRIPDNPF